MTYAEFATIGSGYSAELNALSVKLDGLIDQANAEELDEGIMQDLADAATTFRNKCRTAHDNFVEAVTLLTV